MSPIDYSVADTKALASLSEQQTKAIARGICPYCRAGLVESFLGSSAGGYWEHSIPRTPHVWPCLASGIRSDIGLAKLAEEERGP